MAASKAYERVLQMARVEGRPSILLRPDNRGIHDESMMFIRGDSPRSTSELIARAACEADAVIIGTPVGRDSFLSHDAQFVLTEYEVAIEQVLRGSGLTPGAAVRYVRPGGRLVVNGRTVNASHNLYPELATNQRYILFMDAMEGAGYKVAGDDPVLLDALVVNSTVRPHGPQGGYPELRAGLRLGDITAVLTEARCGAL